MYKVYCDNSLLYDGKREELKLFNAKIDSELNKVSSFNFTIYPKHKHFNKLKKLKSLMKVYRNDKIVFRGRILNDTRGFYNEKKVVCESELAFLIDSIQRPYNYTGSVEGLFTQFITNHNAQVDMEHQFKVGQVTVVDPNDYINRSDTQYLTTWDSINKKLIEPLGGYLIVRYESDGVYIDYLAELDGLITQEIEFGKNMISFEEAIKGDELITGIIPLGASIKDEQGNDTGLRLTIESVNDGLDYIQNDEAVETYGRIFKTQIWDDVTIADNLLRKAQEYLASAIMLSAQITLNAVDLSYVNKEIGSFQIGANVKVKSKPHNLDAYFLVSKLSLNLLKPQNDKLTLGMTYKTFTEQNSSQEQNIVDKVTVNIGEDLSNIGNSIVETERRLTAQIEATSSGIMTSVSKKYVTKEEQIQLEESMNARFEETNNSFDFSIQEINKKIVDTGWVDLTLNSGWSYQYDTDKPQYRRIGNVVYLRGLVDGTASAPTTIGELPVGYRPSAGAFNRFACALNQKDYVNIQVGRNGLITDYTKTTSTTRTFICLSGISFFVNI
ncbi:phage tail spike protein [Thomasclavelia ramosa]|uniref:Tail spike domain-containing protein n=1 Tax=Thomasclavelia ramosa TaxID=1547 RepID=A0A3E3E9N8_9FIRM|nr:phage tail spike protein [Thomasclavelia ramosa]RGD80340.1 hypothetical protein DXB93_15300 [Thomasclavelia ramosa]